jgi:hypothetical protein
MRDVERAPVAGRASAVERLPNLDAVAAAATRRWRTGGPASLVEVLAETVEISRVLEIGSSQGETAARVLRAGGARVRRYVLFDADATSVAATRTRAEVVAYGGGITVHHARLGGTPADAPHFTRDTEAVRTFCEGAAFDLVVVEAPPAADALYLALSIVLPAVAPNGLCCVLGWSATPGAEETIARVTREHGVPALVWEPEPGAPAAVLLRGRTLRHGHEDMHVLRDALTIADTTLAEACTRGDHGAIATRVRQLLARQLTWSTPDLLLPLDAFPPALSVLDVVQLGRLGEGGVAGWGAAVTLAMLYRAFGYPATVYQFGVPGVLWHMAALVGLPDGRILLQDAFFDAELTADGRTVPWTDAVAMAARGEAARLALAPEEPGTRSYLYSSAALECAVADGWLAPGEAAEIVVAAAGCRRLAGAPRAVLERPIAAFADWTALPGPARALAELARRGLSHPLALLALPCGRMPLAGARPMDAEIAAVLARLAAPAAAAAPASDGRAIAGG